MRRFNLRRFLKIGKTQLALLQFQFGSNKFEPFRTRFTLFGSQLTYIIGQLCYVMLRVLILYIYFIYCALGN